MILDHGVHYLEGWHFCRKCRVVVPSTGLTESGKAHAFDRLVEMFPGYEIRTDFAHIEED